MTMEWRLRGWLAPMVAALALSIAVPQAIAQTPAPVPQPKSTPSEQQSNPPAATREDLQNMLQTLRDPAKRDALAKQVETLLQVQQAGAPPAEERGVGARVLSTLSSGFQQFTQFTEQMGHGFGGSGHLLSWLEVQGSDPTLRGMWMNIGTDLGLSLGAGLIVAYLVSLAVKAGRRRLALRAGDRLLRRIRFAAARLVLEILPIVAFGLVAFGALGWLAPPEIARLALLAMINATLATMASMVLVSFLLSPMEPPLRLVPLRDSAAVYLYIWSRRLIIVAVWGYVFLQTGLLLGMPNPAYIAASKILGFALTALIIILILQNREGMAHWIRGTPAPEGGRRIVPGLVRGRLAEIWHVVAIAYLAGFYLVWALEVAGGFLYLARATGITLLVIAAVAAGEVWLPRLFNRFSGLDAALVARYPLVAARANRYVPILRRALVYIIRIAAILLILAAWRVNVGGALFSNTGRDVLGRTADIAIVVVIALASWEIAGGLITAHLNRRDETGNSIIRSARIRTLLPLIRNALLIVISVMAGLIILSEIGVDIAPLLAGAGVVGLAIGFGAQSLVKDVIAGAFFMFEGTINLGDIVDIGGKSGLVEGMTIRSLRLRDLNGSLHTVNFGSVAIVTNMTREFSYYVIDTKVSYQYDPDDVMAVLRQTDEELRAEPDFKHYILQPIEILGLESFADTSFIVRARIRTRPIKQWDVGREFNRRLKHNLERRGIVQAVPGAPAFVASPQAQAKLQQPAQPQQPIQPQEPAQKHASNRKH
ncbi:MAG TPA: mechanosensitive ion channel domain-containing protein [Dongiaceae bacterium]|jgi:small conductance mechanosensitive channel|nr:mechanosensitive ion channel domain-containing protein [Dongiaceae bacterium]